MNREIKFRVWDIKNKEWLEDADTFYGVRYFTVGNGEVFKVEYDVETRLNKWESLDDIEVQQYTGLKDKRNKEVYEGDIIKFKYPLSGDGVVLSDDEIRTEQTLYNKDVIGVVENTFPQFNGCNLEIVGYIDGMKYLFHLSTIMNSKLIGNIFENPELL